MTVDTSYPLIRWHEKNTNGDEWPCLTEFEKQLTNRPRFCIFCSEVTCLPMQPRLPGLFDPRQFLWKSTVEAVTEKRPGQAQRQMTDIQLLDEQEVSRRLSVSVNTLRYWRACGDGPNYVKLGRLVRYDAVALEKFILRNLRVSKARATMEEKHVAL